MRKILCMLLAGVLLGLWGCGVNTPANREETKITTAALAATQLESEPESEPESMEDSPEDKWVALTPPQDCELLDSGFAKTKTHYFAAHEGGIIYAPVGDLAGWESVPLPKEHEGMALAYADICGITEQHLYVNLREDDESRRIVTFRISLDDWEAEALLTERYDYHLPWYHPAGDALLIPRRSEDENEEGFRPMLLEIMPLDSRQRSTVELEGEPVTYAGHWRNTLDGRATATVGDVIEFAERANYYYVFDAQNQVSKLAHEELEFALRLVPYGEFEAPKNAAEQSLILYLKLEEGIRTYASCGEYLYYVQRDLERDHYDLHRMKIDINEDEVGSGPLRENTQIFQLHSVGGKLFCQADNPSVTRGDDRSEPIESEIGIYLLDEQGQHAQTLFRYWDCHTGNSGYGLTTYGDHLMVTYHVIYGYHSVTFLYDPGSGAMFPPQYLC